MRMKESHEKKSEDKQILGEISFKTILANLVL